jgi:hypothetical protein
MCNWKWKRATVSQSSPGQELVYESQHVTTSFHAILWITKSHERFAHTHLHIEMKLDWQITSQVHQFIPVDAFTFSFRQPIGPISITSFDALKGLRGFGGAGIGRPSERHCSCIKAFSRWPRGPVFSQLTTKMEIECGKTFQMFPLYSHSMSFNNVSLLFFSGITDLFLGKMQNYRVKGRMNAQTWSNLHI